MAIQIQSYCLLEHWDGLIHHVAEIHEALEATHKRTAEIVEPQKRVRMAIRSQSYWPPQALRRTWSCR
jgi:hypothetical protein